MQSLELASRNRLFVRQKFEGAELIGFETRNKYQILDEHQTPVAYAAEQQKGILSFLMRQYLGHWRRFDIWIFNTARQKVMTVTQPFRWIFKRLEIADESGRFVGAIQQRFAFFSKRFDVEDQHGAVVMEVSSPFYKFWTFPFVRQGREVASVQKKWSGALSEIFTDRDNFMVEFKDDTLSVDQRALVLCAAIFIDLRYFETKASSD